MIKTSKNYITIKNISLIIKKLNKGQKKKISLYSGSIYKELKFMIGENTFNENLYKTWRKLRDNNIVVYTKQAGKFREFKLNIELLRLYFLNKINKLK